MRAVAVPPVSSLRHHEQSYQGQAFIVGALFGWKRKDGFRRFRRAYIEEGKGNGKSPLAAGIGLYGMMADGEDRAEVYAAASDRDQAMVLFRDAVAMVDQSPALDQRITQPGENPVWQLTDLKTASFFKPLSREKRKKGSGPRPHFALCDEVHEHPQPLARGRGRGGGERMRRNMIENHSTSSLGLNRPGGVVCPRSPYLDLTYLCRRRLRRGWNNGPVHRAAPLTAKRCSCACPN